MDDERALVNSLKRRDPDALAAVFERYSDKIYRLAVRLLQDEQQADGVVQETFLALIGAVDRFEQRAQISTWLYRVAYNECMSRLRKQRPHVELDHVEDWQLMPTALIDWQMLPENVLSSGEALAVMDDAIAQLNPKLRAVFTLRDIEELSTQETADVLDISASAVKVRLHRARLFLREKLAAYFEHSVA